MQELYDPFPTTVGMNHVLALIIKLLVFIVYHGNIQTMINFEHITGFDWDEGNLTKNEKHQVSPGDSEQVFFNKPLLVQADVKHSQQEPRYHALGKTDAGRLLHITFTLRFANTKIRVISARDMHQKERAVYEQAT